MINTSCCSLGGFLLHRSSFGGVVNCTYKYISRALHQHPAALAATYRSADYSCSSINFQPFSVSALTSSFSSSSVLMAATNSTSASSPSTSAGDSVSSSSTSSSSTTSSARHIKVYTKTGDKGTSALFTMERRPKDDIAFQSLGSIDELNAFIGVAIEHINDTIAKTLSSSPSSSSVDDSSSSSSSSAAPSWSSLHSQLEEIQSRLFDLGSHVATPRSSASSNQLQLTVFSEDHVLSLEHWIDAMDEQLTPLRNFILPSGGGHISCALHVCRAVCRRAERTIVPLVADGAVDGVVGRYLNRLSDYFFIASRWANMKCGRGETIWKKPRQRAAPAEKSNTEQSK